MKVKTKLHFEKYENEIFKLKTLNMQLQTKNERIEKNIVSKDIFINKLTIELDDIKNLYAISISMLNK